MSTVVGKDAVFVKSEELSGSHAAVHGPHDISDANPLSHIRALSSIGFQATNFGKALDIVRNMMQCRRDIAVEASRCAVGDNASPPSMKIYLGVTANMLGTGVREAIVFLARHRLVDVLVVTGGGVEHDLRRTVVPEAYSVDSAGPSSPSHTASSGHFGNITYAKRDPTYEDASKRLLRKVLTAQALERRRSLAAPIPTNSYDDVCTWSLGPSDIWRLVGEDLLSVVDATRAESSLLHWCARNGIPIYSPSFSDGDIYDVLRDLYQENPELQLTLDLVKDIHGINRSAMSATKTGMIVLGGGVAKHHVCNANLMRNGADFSIFINNGQEYDGSDAGARPDEAVSWGKIRTTAEFVKVYAEITLVFPLLVALGFAPFAKESSSNTPQATDRAG